MKTNKKGLSIIKKFEGCKLEAYKCPAGIWTIGYGHVLINWTITRIEQIEAEQFLIRDIEQREHLLDNLLEKENVCLTSNQYSALISLIFNVGIGAFEKSKMWQKICKKDFAGAATEFDGWDKAGGKALPGLTARRAAEKELFLS